MMKIKDINKKGLSSIIIAVLLILLVLTSIIVIWFFVKPFISTQSAKSAAQADLLGVSFSAKSVSVNDGKVEFILKRNSGGGIIKGVYVTIEDKKKNSKSFRNNNSINELESKKMEFDYPSGFGTLSSISITPITESQYGDVSGNTQIVYSDTDISTGTEIESGEPAISGFITSEENAYCLDKDSGELNTQSLSSSFVLYYINACDNTLDEDCSYIVSATDVCLNANILAEQTCNGNSHRVVEVQCVCSDGKCI